MSESKDESRPSIPVVIGTVLLLAGFVLQFFTSRSALPFEVQLASTGIIAVAAILFVVWLWYQPLRRIGKTWQRNQIARRNYPRLIRFVERFRDLAGQTRVFAPHNVLEGIRNTEGFRPIITVESWWVDSLSSDLEKGIRTAKPSLKTFSWGVNSLMSMTRFYNEVYVSKPVLQIRAILDSGTVKLQPNLRDNFNASREKLVGFIGEFEEFVSQTSVEIGEDRVKAGNTWTTLSFLVAWHLERPPSL